MDETPKRRSRLGNLLTTAGGVLGILGFIAMRIGLKATITPSSHNVVLIKEVLSTGGFIVFGLAIALIVGGAVVGRRAMAKKDEGPVQASAQTSPNLIPDFPPESAPASPDRSSEKLPSERSSS